MNQSKRREVYSSTI